MACTRMPLQGEARQQRQAQSGETETGCSECCERAEVVLPCRTDCPDRSASRTAMSTNSRAAPTGSFTAAQLIPAEPKSTDGGG